MIDARDYKAMTQYLATAAGGLISAVVSEEWGTPLHLACIGTAYDWPQPRQSIHALVRRLEAGERSSGDSFA